jgi:hypothetical protein
VTDSHVRVLAQASREKPVFEMLPASPAGPQEYDILGSPVLTTGFAAGDRLRVADDGTFEVVHRGGNLCLVLFPASPPETTDFLRLTTAFEGLGGLAEMPPDGRFVVITVPLAAGFGPVEKALTTWIDDRDCPWGYGNVFDDDDQPLDWWQAPAGP